MNTTARFLRFPLCLLLAGSLLILVFGRAAPAPATPRPMAAPAGAIPRCGADAAQNVTVDAVRCGASVLFVPSQAAISTHDVAFRNGELVAIKNLPVEDSFTQPGWWRESGSAGEPGTLWWGRSSSGRFWAVGWESHGFLMRHLLLQTGRPGSGQATQTLIEAGKGKIVPFRAAKMSYAQFAAPQGVLSGGSGGDGAPFMPVPVTRAALTLETVPSLQGELQFDVVIEGRVRNFRIPLKRNVKEARDGAAPRVDELFRLRAGDIRRDDGKIVDCSPDPYASEHCEYDARESYGATGVFFGANSEYLAVRFVLEVDIPERQKTGSMLDGLVILRAKP